MKAEDLRIGEYYNMITSGNSYIFHLTEVKKSMFDNGSELVMGNYVCFSNKTFQRKGFIFYISQIDNCNIKLADEKQMNHLKQCEKRGSYLDYFVAKDIIVNDFQIF